MTRESSKNFLINGAPWIWLSGGMLSLLFLMLIGMLSIIIANAFSFFWPYDLAEFELNSSERIYGQIVETKGGKGESKEAISEYHIKRGGRDIFSADFIWIQKKEIKKITYPNKLALVERTEWGNVYGMLEDPGESNSALSLLVDEKNSIEIDRASVVEFLYPNRLSFLQKLEYSTLKFGSFLSDNPRESNTEGGVFPAIFGTVLLVFIMSIVVTPLGVLAAIYLREYAKQGPLVSAVRIAVNNLAAVPSIVFGVFGLGFFIYYLGGSIDSLFFSESLPTPTFGTGGLLWASLTLALMTVPTVIVATEEGLSSISRSLREASFALGATRYETTLKVVIPSLLPSILTGVILAVARAAGEVAPLMITGVVKLAPSLPIDGSWPFFHLNRKFMHLGFHIYDVGFQSPNAQAAKAMVFATSALLIGIVLISNLIAIVLRAKIRKKLQNTNI